jgi:hypothetical protein
LRAPPPSPRQRCLYAYFVGTPMEEIPYLKLPQHTVVELSPGPHGTTVRHHNLDPSFVDATV